MKNKIFSVSVILSLFFLNMMAQDVDRPDMPVDPNSNLITYREVVEEEGTKDEFFNRCVDWLNNFYKNPVAVSKVRDQASGIVKGQHQFRIYNYEEDHKKDAGMIMYDFKIELKEGRYRYTVDKFLLRKASRFPVEKWLDRNAPDFNEKYDSYLQQINSFMKEEWIPSLKERMKPEIEVEEEEW